MRRFAAVLVVALILVGCDVPGSGADDEPEVVAGETPTPADDAGSTPTPVPGELPVLPADELVARLLGGDSPFPVLPSGYRVETTETSRDDATGSGAQRVVAYQLAGPDLRNAVTFYIYEDAQAARDGYSNLTAVRRIRGEAISGLPYPAKTISYAEPDRSAGYTIIYVWAGQTVIEAISGLAVETPAGEFTHAFELAEAGIAHLEDVLIP